MQWRFARAALESPELGVSRFTYEPGARMPWGHRHLHQEEIYAGPFSGTEPHGGRSCLRRSSSDPPICGKG